LTRSSSRDSTLSGNCWRTTIGTAFAKAALGSSLIHCLKTGRRAAASSRPRDSSATLCAASAATNSAVQSRKREITSPSAGRANAAESAPGSATPPEPPATCACGARHSAPSQGAASRAPSTDHLSVTQHLKANSQQKADTNRQKDKNSTKTHRRWLAFQRFGGVTIRRDDEIRSGSATQAPNPSRITPPCSLRPAPCALRRTGGHPSRK
jgi:hypothetical protein